jgi:hypothetical protein
VFEVRTFDGWWEITSPQIAGLFIANPDAGLVFGDLLKSWRLLYELNGPAHVVEPPRAPGPSDLQGKLPGLLEALADTVRQLEHHKQTHEQWRDCEQSHRDANPKIGDSAFHAECVENYETMISAVKYAAEFARAAVPKDQARPTSDTQGREPVAWLYEDTLPKEYPYDAMFKHSQVRGGVRMFPVFAPSGDRHTAAQPVAPQEPVDFAPMSVLAKQCSDGHFEREMVPLADLRKLGSLYLAPTPQVAPKEPVVTVEITTLESGGQSVLLSEELMSLPPGKHSLYLAPTPQGDSGRDALLKLRQLREWAQRTADDLEKSQGEYFHGQSVAHTGFVAVIDASLSPYLGTGERRG